MFGEVRRKFGDAAKNVAQGVAQDVAQEEVASKYVGSGYSGHSDLLSIRLKLILMLAFVRREGKR